MSSSGAAASAATDAGVAGFVGTPSATRTALDARYGQVDGGGKLLDPEIPDRLRTAQPTREYVATSEAPINPKHPRYGAVGDGVADDSAALQAALNDAGVGGRVVLSPGVYRCLTGLITPTFCSLEGSTTEFGAGNPARTELTFPAAAGAFTGLTLGINASLRNLVIRGPGSGVAGPIGVAGAAVRFDRVSTCDWDLGTDIAHGYYCQFYQAEWRHNATGLRLNDVFNMAFFGPVFNCQSTDGLSYGTAITIAAGSKGPRPLSIFGGSVENYGAVGIQLARNCRLNLFGVYFETSDVSGGVSVAAAGFDGVGVLAAGCLVYLNGQSYFINLTGSTNAQLVGHGNKFVTAVGSPTAPTVYRVTPGQAVDLSGDDFSEMAKVGCSYAAASTGSILGVGLRISWPSGTFGGAAVGALVASDGHQEIETETRQTLAVAGAVTIDASTAGAQVVALQANATSTTITSHIDGQLIRITFEQDATGGRTYAWPAVCKFAGNAAPADTTASTRTTVAFRYRAFTNRFYELARSVAVPN